MFTTTTMPRCNNNNHHDHHGPPPLHHVRQHECDAGFTPVATDHAGGSSAGQEWAFGIPNDNGMQQCYDVRMPYMPPAAYAAEFEKEEEHAGAGCCYSAAADTGEREAAGCAYPTANAFGVEVDWKCLLDDLRASAGVATDGCVGSSRVVGVQPAHGVLRAQTHRSTVETCWVVNPLDWIDVEHVLRRMLRCESSECHAFNAMSYIFFRSCAVSHVSSPSEYLKEGMVYRFAGTDAVVELLQVDRVEGVLEVGCFLEYVVGC